MNNHRWKFFRAGGVDQVSLESASDLLNLDALDQKLWVALSCPTKGVEFDTKTLELIDTDKDGRIRAPDIIAAVKWAAAHLKDPAQLLNPGAGLPLDQINDAGDEGKRIRSSAQQILTNLNKTDAKVVTVEDTADTARVFSATKFNGDGIIPPDASADPKVQQTLNDIIATAGPEPDRMGAPGVSQARADLFFTEAQAYVDWNKKSEAAGVLPLGANTVAALAALDAIRGKVDDYFVRTRLAEFDPRAVPALNRLETEYLTVTAKDISAAAAETASFPIARIESRRPLPLRDGLNPAWAAAVAKFRDLAVQPLLGEKNALTEAEWIEVNNKLSACRAWQAAKTGAIVEKLGLPRVQEILAGADRATINDLLAKDKALEPEMTAIAAVERLTRYHRDLFRLLKNFVSFADFYSAGKLAIFQSGRLYLDARSCDLCIKVADIGKHSALATLSRTYIAYCECTRRGSTEKMNIAAAITGGDSDNLMVGRNGIFYDRAGNDWDATITRIVEHPISIRQAILAPYKRFAKMVGEQIEKMAASRDKALTDKAAANLKTLETSPAPGAPAAAAKKEEAFDAAKFAGIFAAIGLAIGTLGTALGSLVSGFLKLEPWWKMPLAVVGILLVISGPSVIIAALKLRQRNLGPLLDGVGWAVNGRMKINIPFGSALTAIAALPEGAERRFEDPYKVEDRVRPWAWSIVFILTLLTIGAVLWVRYAVELR